ncbi:DUF4244 domain-containing protein [Propionibacteriaceae bacterium Y2011]|uniref:DUF4244 domain-containing protein n=1 Tax=Microlunatus sp. Y2014 TaxID=3418488 RepID=UPI003B4D46E4
MSNTHETASTEIVPVAGPYDNDDQQQGTVARRRRTRRDLRGMTTAEYAVGTVATVGFAGVLIKILSDPELQGLILQLILWIIRTVGGFGN